MDRTQQAVEIFNKYAFEYQDRFMDVSLYSTSFNFFCDSITTNNANILELACGPGNVSKYLLNKRPDFKLLGTDLSFNMIQLAKKNNPTAEFQLLDAREIRTIQNKYDGIMCGFCLPYLTMNETQKLIHEAWKLLHSKGLLYLSTMEDEYSNSGIRKGSQGDEIFMHYYTEHDLNTLLNLAEFQIVFIDRKESIQTNGDKVIDLSLIAQKK